MYSTQKYCKFVCVCVCFGSDQLFHKDKNICQFDLEGKFLKRDVFFSFFLSGFIRKAKKKKNIY